MKRYFYNRTIVELEAENSLILGTSIDEPNKFIPFTDEQNEFKDQNPTATADEVINMEMNEEINSNEISPETELINPTIKQYIDNVLDNFKSEFSSSVNN